MEKDCSTPSAALPTSFRGARSSFWNVGTGCDGLGRFHVSEIHVSEIIQQAHPWWLLDRKEKTSCLNREASRWCYRGSYTAEKTPEEGRNLSEIFVRICPNLSGGVISPRCTNQETASRTLKVPDLQRNWPGLAVLSV